MVNLVLKTSCIFFPLEKKQISGFLFMIIIIMMLLNSCSKNQQHQESAPILAKIGDRSITVDEFINRAEYTIRPPYCNREYYIHRKIVLNSLIAEKLMALEAGTADELTMNERYQNYITGRKEQAMRTILYQKIAVEKVKLDTSEIKQAFKLAGRKYKLRFCSLNDNNIAHELKTSAMTTNKSLTDVCKQQFGIDELPVHEIEWDSQSEGAIQDALFTKSLKKGQLIGPVKTADDHYLLMEVEGWIDRPVISETAVKHRWNGVKEYLTTKYASQKYGEYAARIMRGKKVEFNGPVFFKLAEMLAPIYIKIPEDTKETFNDLFWQKERTPAPEIKEIDDIINEQLLQINDQVWTVRDFKNELERHPLVFRNRRMSHQDFPEQFKLAIVDLIRDKYITQDAYKKGYDKLTIVQQQVAMWEDNMLALYQATKYLAKKGISESNSSYMQVIEEHLNPYVDSLQFKYNEQIEINTDKFEQIELTNIDMVVLQENVPFPVIIPGFPLLTTDNKLNYGKKMN